MCSSFLSQHLGFWLFVRALPCPKSSGSKKAASSLAIVHVTRWRRGQEGHSTSLWKELPRNFHMPIPLTCHWPWLGYTATASYKENIVRAVFGKCNLPHPHLERTALMLCGIQQKRKNHMQLRVGWSLGFHSLGEKGSLSWSPQAWCLRW